MLVQISVQPPSSCRHSFMSETFIGSFCIISQPRHSNTCFTWIYFGQHQNIFRYAVFDFTVQNQSIVSPTHYLVTNNDIESIKIPQCWAIMRWTLINGHISAKTLWRHGMEKLSASPTHCEGKISAGHKWDPITTGNALLLAEGDTEQTADCRWFQKSLLLSLLVWHHMMTQIIGNWSVCSKGVNKIKIKSPFVRVSR